MAERKAVNKYYPPEWTPEQGGLNKFHGQHALRERAKKLHLGILVIRFELPYDVWCDGCGRHIAKGVRFNAEKKCIGKYLSTKIWSFRMKCPSCSYYIEIHTDPKACDYVVASGAKRKTETYEPDEGEVEKLEDAKEVAKRAENAFYRLEHATASEVKAKEAMPRLEQIKSAVDRTHEDDFAMSSAMRKKFRTEKKELKKKEVEETKLLHGGWKVAIPLLEANDADKRAAKEAVFKRASGFDESLVSKRLKIKAGSIFGGGLAPDAERRLQALAKSRRRSADPSALVADKGASLSRLLVGAAPGGPSIASRGGRAGSGHEEEEDEEEEEDGDAGADGASSAAGSSGAGSSGGVGSRGGGAASSSAGGSGRGSARQRRSAPPSLSSGTASPVSSGIAGLRDRGAGSGGSAGGGGAGGGGGPRMSLVSGDYDDVDVGDGDGDGD
eukprot:tig00000248_g21824.t1